MVTQQDIDEFKKQIQTDLQRIAQVLEENTIKQMKLQTIENVNNPLSGYSVNNPATAAELRSERSPNVRKDR